jgi:hypothetical protein
LNHPFPIYGYVNNRDGNPQSGLSVEIYVEGSLQDTLTTDANGYFQGDLQNYSNNGDTIIASGAMIDWFGDYSYTLDVTDLSKDLSFNLDHQYTDLKVYYDATHYINVWCSNWVVRDKSITVTFVVTKSQLDTIKANTRPGAVRMLYECLGDKVYTDTTFSDSNTLKFVPVDHVQSKLFSDRRETVGFVNNVSYTPIGAHNKRWVCQLECFVSGSTY